MRFPSKIPTDHWCATAYSYEAAEALDRHLRPGGPVRMAILLHLARYPEGVSQAMLWAVVKAALPANTEAPTPEDMQVMCGQMMADGLLAVEAGKAGWPTYYTPNARRAARVRRLHGHLLPPGLQPAKVLS